MPGSFFTRRLVTAEQKPAPAVEPIEPATLQAQNEAKTVDKEAGLHQDVEGERGITNFTRQVTALQRQLDMR